MRDYILCKDTNDSYIKSEYTSNMFDFYRVLYDEHSPDMIFISSSNASNVPNVLSEEESFALDEMLERRDELFENSFKRLAEIGKKIEYR